MNANVDANVPFNEINTNVGLTGSVNNSAVEFVNKLKDRTLSPIGFKTIMLRNGFTKLFKPPIKYVGDTDNPQDFMIERSDESPEPIIYQ